MLIVGQFLTIFQLFQLYIFFCGPFGFRTLFSYIGLLKKRLNRKTKWWNTSKFYHEWPTLRVRLAQGVDQWWNFLSSVIFPSLFRQFRQSSVITIYKNFIIVPSLFRHSSVSSVILSYFLFYIIKNQIRIIRPNTEKNYYKPIKWIICFLSILLKVFKCSLWADYWQLIIYVLKLTIVFKIKKCHKTAIHLKKML